MFDAVTWCIIDLLCRKDAVCTSFILYFAPQAVMLIIHFDELCLAFAEKLNIPCDY